MTYKVIRNAQGETVCFGPNDNNYEPMVKAGEVLSIEDNVPSPSKADLQHTVNQKALAYLQSTDWYILRQADNGTPVPSDITAARQAAREGVK